MSDDRSKSGIMNTILTHGSVTKEKDTAMFYTNSPSDGKYCDVVELSRFYRRVSREDCATFVWSVALLSSVPAYKFYSCSFETVRDSWRLIRHLVP